MDKKIRSLTHGAIIAAMYVALTYLQNFILPNSTSWAIQLRVSETLCILSFFTPAAIPGLTLGCLLFNLSYAGALPLDIVVGTGATLLATTAMWHSRKLTLRGVPVPGLAMPALFNAILVGWELTVYIGQAFWLNALYVALGELIVLYTAGLFLYCFMKKRHLDTRLFG
ncbi:MAG: QueT transporter family protein [Oscillospiraceae bacterium]|nr:QueT transporter family protein [Oscillospiraceae bacterium]